MQPLTSHFCAPSLQETRGSAKRHFWLSQLGKEGSLESSERGLGSCKASYDVQDSSLSPTKYLCKTSTVPRLRNPDKNKRVPGYHYTKNMHLHKCIISQCSLQQLKTSIFNYMWLSYMPAIQSVALVPQNRRNWWVQFVYSQLSSPVPWVARNWDQTAALLQSRFRVGGGFRWSGKPGR